MKTSTLIRSLIISLAITQTAPIGCATSAPAAQKQGIGNRVAQAIKRGLIKGREGLGRFKEELARNPLLLALKYRLLGRLASCDMKQSKVLEEQARELAAKMGHKNSNLRVFLTSDLPSDACTVSLAGFGPKTILLSRNGWEELSKEEQDFVLAHETAHTTEPLYSRALNFLPLTILISPLYAQWNSLWQQLVHTINHKVPPVATVVLRSALEVYLILKYRQHVIDGRLSRYFEKRADLLAGKALGTNTGGMEFFANCLKARGEDLTPSVKKVRELISKKGPPLEIKQQFANLHAKLSAIPVWKHNTHPPHKERLEYLAKAQETLLAQGA